MFTIQIARISLGGRFQERTCTGTQADCDEFAAENEGWTVISVEPLTAAEIEAREIRAEWRVFRAEVAA
jgi:hypothetical protein